MRICRENRYGGVLQVKYEQELKENTSEIEGVRCGGKYVRTAGVEDICGATCVSDIDPYSTGTVDVTTITNIINSVIVFLVHYISRYSSLTVIRTKHDGMILG